MKSIKYKVWNIKSIKYKKYLGIKKYEKYRKCIFKTEYFSDKV